MKLKKLPEGYLSDAENRGSVVRVDYMAADKEEKGNMIPKYAYVYLDSGVDTQLISKDGSGKVSARYMMSGVDSASKQCKIFIENECVISGTGEMNTTPKIVTDSMELSWLQEKTLYGKVAVEEDDKLHVRIYV